MLVSVAGVDFTGMGSSVATHAAIKSPPVAVLQSEPAELSQSADKEARTTTNITSIDIPVPMPESTEQMSPTLNRQTGSSVETPLPVCANCGVRASARS